MSLTITSLPGIPIIQPGDNLVTVILTSLQQVGISLRDGSLQELLRPKESDLFR